MPIMVAMKARQNRTNLEMPTSMMANFVYAGWLIRAKKSVNEIIVRTSTKMPANRPLLALAQSTE